MVTSIGTISFLRIPVDKFEMDILFWSRNWKVITAERSKASSYKTACLSGIFNEGIKVRFFKRKKRMEKKERKK